MKPTTYDITFCVAPCKERRCGRNVLDAPMGVPITTANLKWTCVCKLGERKQEGKEIGKQKSTDPDACGNRTDR